MSEFVNPVYSNRIPIKKALYFNDLN